MTVQERPASSEAALGQRHQNLILILNSTTIVYRVDKVLIEETDIQLKTKIKCSVINITEIGKN